MSWEEMARKMMNRLLVVTLAAVVAIEILGCTAPVNAAKGPVITSISPSSVTAGGAGFTLTVNGSSFNGNSNVLWNGAQRPTVTINSTQLQAFISNTDIATVGTVQITVVDPKPFPHQSNPTSLTINSVSLTITTSSLPTAVVQLPYSAAVTNSGGIAPYTWKLVSGQLPPGLALGSTSGAISGIPGQTGSYGFTTEVIDSSPIPQTASQTLGVSVTAPSLLSINTTTLTNGTVQTAYSATFSATGGTAPYSWSVASGSLPPGVDWPVDWPAFVFISWAGRAASRQPPATRPVWRRTLHSLLRRDAALTVVLRGRRPTYPSRPSTQTPERPCDQACVCLANTPGRQM